MGKNDPKYIVIMEYYIKKIEDNQLIEGDKMQGETEVCKLFNVSRITARRALSELESLGYIERFQGKGSFVKNIKTDMHLDRLQSFSEEMRMMGYIPSTKVLGVEVIDAPIKVAQSLQISLDAKVYRIERLRYANNIAMALEVVYIPFYLCSGLEQHHLEGSLYEILKEKYGINIVRANQSIEAVSATDEIGLLLEVPKGSPVLNIRRLTYIEKDTPFEYVSSIYRGDKYKFHVDLLRK